MMLAVKIRITRFISADNPGFVECKFTDAWNHEHTVHEKVPIVTQDFLDENSSYPQEGSIACTLIKETVSGDNQVIVTVNTLNPWGIESMEGKYEFDMIKQDLIDLK